MRILGIDPGLATIGFGIIEIIENHPKVLDFGHIQTAKTLSNASRLNQISTDLQEICNKWRPNVCAIEELYFSKNTSTALKVAEARGVILHTINRLGYPIFEYNPGQIKIAVTGNGKATKPEMQKMITLILKLTRIPRPDDAADALAIALCHSQTKF